MKERTQKNLLAFLIGRVLSTHSCRLLSGSEMNFKSVNQSGYLSTYMEVKIDS